MTYIIAEAGINHVGSLDRALKMVDVAHYAGADAVKFQSFWAKSLGYDDALTSKLIGWQLSEDDHVKLKLKADKRGIEFMSTPFDTKWMAFLVKLGVKRLKISSGKVKDVEFMQAARATGLPLIISNGMCTPEELKAVTLEQDTILYCVSKYPTPLHEVNLQKMFNLRAFYRHVGFSDHTEGKEASILAAAAGADVIEKHFTMDSFLPGPDQICSLEPDELREMVAEIRKVKSK